MATFSMTTKGKRHLPVLAGPSRAPTPEPEPTAGEASQEPPPWHWIPLGTTVSVVAFALLAQGVARASHALLARVYGPSATAQDVARVRASHPVGERLAELAPGALAVLALFASVALGGYFVGRYGARTNARHGTLAGALTVLLLWAVTRFQWFMLAMVPFAAAAAWLAARGGVAVRSRAT